MFKIWLKSDEFEGIKNPLCCQTYLPRAVANTAKQPTLLPAPVAKQLPCCQQLWQAQRAAQSWPRQQTAYDPSRGGKVSPFAPSQA